ncbi:MAG TPA: hypothetical protein VFU99_12855 [Gaiellaceae bacterium]|nr:hypothetical protein [Gaiellaceae bacterium]
MKKLLLLSAALAIASASWAALASADPPAIPPNWHAHDGVAAPPQHRPIGFFPTILKLDSTQYLQDPALCPDATDKAFLPQGRQDEQPLRAGICQTSSKIIHLRTVPADTAGPNGWSGPIATTELGLSWHTYYRVTDR